MPHCTPSLFLKLLATLKQGEKILQGQGYFAWASINGLWPVVHELLQLDVAFGV